MTFLLQVLHLWLGFILFEAAEHSRWRRFLAVPQASSRISTFSVIPSLCYLEGSLSGIVMAEGFVGVGVVCVALWNFSVQRLSLDWKV